MNYADELGELVAEHVRELREARAENAWMARELERWRHGGQVEGDYVCPDSLGYTEARAENARLREALEGAGRSLLAIRQWSYEDWDAISVRGYASNRADVAFAALAPRAGEVGR